MYIEIIVVVGRRQASVFYGPFSSEEARRECRNFLQKWDALYCRRFGEERWLAHLKYLSCDALPPGDWKKLPPLERPFDEISGWVRPEIYNDCLPPPDLGSVCDHD